MVTTGIGAGKFLLSEIAQFGDAPGVNRKFSKIDNGQFAEVLRHFLWENRAAEGEEPQCALTRLPDVKFSESPFHAVQIPDCGRRSTSAQIRHEKPPNARPLDRNVKFPLVGTANKSPEAVCSCMAKNTAKKTAPGIKLGSLVKDSITGFTGIAIGRTEFGFGCIHIRIQAQGLTKEGDPIPVHSFDDQRVEVLEKPTKSWPDPKRTATRLGNVVRDTLSGAVGVASGITTDLSGQVNVIIEQPGLTQDGEPKSPLYIDADRVVVVDKRELKVSEYSTATSGGPMARGAGMSSRFAGQ